MTPIDRCRSCVLPASLPSLSLGEDGTCGGCAGYRSRKERDAGRPRKKEEFEALVERARKLDRTYDCLIPLSGGKDSTYALYLCEKVYKLKCLCVTFDNGYLAPGALANIQAALAATRADHIMYQVSRAVMLDLYKLFLRKTGAFCPPCLRGIGLAASLAERFRIPLTVAGTGWQVGAAARALEAGWSKERIVDLTSRVWTASETIYTLDDLRKSTSPKVAGLLAKEHMPKASEGRAGMLAAMTGKAIETLSRDDDGYFWFVGRSDDVIKSSGYRIGPFEVESALLEHPAVQEAAVVGSPDRIRGMIVKAFVVLTPDYTASDALVKELQTYVKKVTAPYKYPRVIEFVESLPKTISGKIRRKELREQEMKKQANGHGTSARR